MKFHVSTDILHSYLMEGCIGGTERISTSQEKDTIVVIVIVIDSLLYEIGK